MVVAAVAVAVAAAAGAVVLVMDDRRVHTSNGTARQVEQDSVFARTSPRLYTFAALE